MNDVRWVRVGWSGRAEIMTTLLLVYVVCGCSSLRDLVPGSGEPEVRVSMPEYWRGGDENRSFANEESTLGSKLPTNPTLNDYLRYAVLHNSALRASYYEWMAALERVPQQESLPDPRVTYAYYFSEVETRVGAQRHRLGVSQTFPWIGKRAMRGDIAAIMAEEKRAEFDAAKLRVFHAVTDAYAEYYYLGRAIEVSRENVALLTFAERLAEARYRVTSGGYADLVRAQVELARLVDRVESLEDLREPLVSRLNAAIGRRLSAQLPWPRELPRTSLGEASDVTEGEVVAGNPELAAIAAASRRHNLVAELAGKSTYPDITFGLQWIETRKRPTAGVSGNGKDAVLGSISLNLPLWGNAYTAAIREGLARGEAAALRRDDLRDRLASELALVLYKARDAERRADLYAAGLIVKAEESLATTLAGYESGEASFIELLDAQRVLLDFKLAHARALADREQHVARGEMIAGRSLRRDESDRAFEAQEIQP